jgi:hypothetical protein
VEADARQQGALEQARGVGHPQGGQRGGGELHALHQQGHGGEQEEGHDGDGGEQVDVVQAVLGCTRAGGGWKARKTGKVSREMVENRLMLCRLSLAAGQDTKAESAANIRKW